MAGLCAAVLLILLHATITWAYSFKAIIPVQDGSSLPVYCFLPDQRPKAPLPAVIVAVGVGSTKIVQYQDHCQNLANRNFAVVLIDPSNFPEDLVPGPYNWDKGMGYVVGSLNQGVVAARLLFTKTSVPPFDQSHG